MSCRHADGDPKCSTKNPRAMAERATAEYKRWVVGQEGPGNSGEEFDIEDAEEVGQMLVLRITYPSCPGCAFEGTKIMIMRATLKEALRWKKIDPHFRQVSETFNPFEAPPPVLRVEPTDLGWKHALHFATYLNGELST